MSVINAVSDLALQAKAIWALPPVVPSSSVPLYVNLQFYQRATVLIGVSNATTVTGSAITLLQAKDVLGLSEKALGFTIVYQSLLSQTADKQVSTTVASNTFTTDSTDNAKLLYQIDIDKASLDSAGGFGCMRLGVGDATAATITAFYLCWPGETEGVLPSALVD